MKDLSHTAAETLDWAGTTYRTMLSTTETGGAMCILDSTSPALSGPPRHIHALEDECFIVLEGEVEFWVAGRVFRKGVGEAAFVPRGVEHTYRSVTPSRHLVILTPGGFEGFFADMARNAYRIPEDMGPIVDSAARHHLSFTGPPL